MDGQSMYQISLVAAFIAGMVALFAPCCISYLFPSYIGNIFRERKHVLAMTIVYSFGIFAVMLPIVLGAKALVSLFFQLHDYTYIVGGIIMIVVAGLSFIGIKLPVHISLNRASHNNDVLSTFTLGVFSGITSACCAPVLIGVLALSSLSPSTLQSLGVGASYVLGMVAPLYIAALFIHKQNILKKPIFKKQITRVKFINTIYPVFVSNILAAVIFFITGSLMVILTITGKLSMSSTEDMFTRQISASAYSISDVANQIPLINFIFAAVIGYGLYYFIRSLNTDDDSNSDEHDCCSPEAEHAQDHHHMSHEHGHHNSHEGHMMHGSAEDFLKRFYIVTALLVPLVLLSNIGVSYIGIPEFVYRPLLEFIIATSIFYFGLVFFQHAGHEIQTKQYGMMTLVSLAVGAGYLFSVASTFMPQIEGAFYLEISTLIWILLFGHFLEAKSSSAAGDALQEVAKLLPKEAHVLLGGDIHDMPINELKKDMVVRVKTGEKVPADGILVHGVAFFNESHITGESKPVQKKKGDEVIAGAIVTDTTVDIKLTRVGDDSTIGHIKKLVSDAQQTKPRVQRLADRAARWLTVSALVISLVSFVVWSIMIGSSYAFAASIAITVLVIACPHALGLAIPAVSTIATRLAVTNGLFIKDLRKLEAARSTDYVVFDKTGTLTHGSPTLQHFEVSDRKNLSKIQSIVLSLEAQSSHVIGIAVAHALKKKADVQEQKVSSFKNIAGSGIQANVNGKKVLIGTRKLMNEQSVALNAELDKKSIQWQTAGQTVAYVAIEKKHVASLSVADTIKPESKEAIVKLHNLGIKVAMLTGDNKDVSEHVSKELTIDTVFAEVLPKDKYKHIQKLQENGNRVMMVGDGVNDAPALTQADVGVAVGAGTDVAVESGDVVLIKSNPEHVVRFVILSRKVYRKMIENLIWALGYNIIALPAAAGLFIPWGFKLTPQIGALVMSLSTVIVVINAMTLRNATLD